MRLAKHLAMQHRTTFLSSVVTLSGLALAGCHGHAPTDTTWAQPVTLDGARNDVFAAVASETHVPVAVLYALAYQQSRFEDPDVTFDSAMDDPITTIDPALAAAPDAWTDASPDEAGEPTLLVDERAPVAGLEDYAATIAIDPASAAYVLGAPSDAADPMLNPTMPLPSEAVAREEGVGDEHASTSAASLFFLTPDQVMWASTTLSITEEDVRSDLESSTRAAAALLLGDLAVSHTPVDAASHARWEEAMVRFVGLDPAGEAGRLAQEDFHAILHEGFDTTTVDGEQMLMVNAGGATLPSLASMPSTTTQPAETASGGAVATESALSSDYPATEWIAASSSNYTSGRGMSIRYVVIHDMEGTLNGAIGVFTNPGAGASAHYNIRARDGHIVQMVREADTAWHSGNWIINHSSIGIEHEGFADHPQGGGYYTATMYEASARLTCAIAHRYGIPVDRRHIFGHGNVSTNSMSTALCSDAQANASVCGGSSHHHDPGRYWDWTLYMNLVARCVRGQSSPTPTPHPSPAPRPMPAQQHALTTGWGGQHALVDASGAVHVFATDAAHRLVEIVRTGSSWSGFHVVDAGGDVHGYPAAIASGDRIVVAVRGVDDRIHVARSSGGTWSNALVLGALTVDTMPSLLVNEDGRVEVFTRGRTDGALYHAAERSPGGDFGQWWNLGGHLTTMPTVTLDAQHHAHVFAIGDADGHVWTRERTSPTTWASWVYLNVTGNSVVSPLRLPDGRLAVFTRNHNGRLVSQVQDSSRRWSLTPHTIGGVLTSNVVAIVDARGRVNVFGRGTDGATYRVVQSASGRWGGFARLGGRAIMGPAVVRTTSGLEVFVAGTNHGLYQAWQTTASRSGWAGWQGRGGRIGWL